MDHNILCHPGIKTTEESIGQHLWWPKMRHHITQFDTALQDVLTSSLLYTKMTNRKYCRICTILFQALVEKISSHWTTSLENCQRNLINELSQQRNKRAEPASD